MKLENSIGCDLGPGTRYTKNGVSVDLLDITGGEAYVRKWPKGVEKQSFFANCLRLPLTKFLDQVKGATVETTPQTSVNAKGV